MLSIPVRRADMEPLTLRTTKTSVKDHPPRRTLENMAQLQPDENPLD
jgi:hypothetical protein